MIRHMAKKLSFTQRFERNYFAYFCNYSKNTKFKKGTSSFTTFLLDILLIYLLAQFSVFLPSPDFSPAL